MKVFRVEVVHRVSAEVYVEAEDAVDAEGQAIRHYFLRCATDMSDVPGVRTPKNPPLSQGPWELVRIASEEVPAGEWERRFEADTATSSDGET